MIKMLLKTFHLKNGKMYATIDGRRVCIAECEPTLEIYEHSATISMIGNRDYTVKSHRIAVVFCDNTETTTDLNENLLRTVRGYALIAELWRKDGVFERIPFDNLIPVEIDMDGKWIFETYDTTLIRKLINM